MDGDLFLIVLTSSVKLETEITTQRLFLVVFAVHIHHSRETLPKECKLRPRVTDSCMLALDEDCPQANTF